MVMSSNASGAGRERSKRDHRAPAPVPAPDVDLPTHLGEHPLDQLPEALAPEAEWRADRDHQREHDESRAA